VNDIKIRILIADDHEFIRDALIRILKSQPDMQVLGDLPMNAPLLRDLYMKVRPKILLLGTRLREDSEEETIRNICQFDPSAKIIVLSSFDFPDKRKKIIEAGAHGFLEKDVHPEELIAIIRHLAVQ
jgi:DNA-binding NarL/FixJ family response regulator